MKRKVSIQLNDVTKKSWSFDGLRELSSFLKKEAKYWAEQRALLNGNQRQVHTHFDCHSNIDQAVKTLESWNDKLESWDDNQLNQQINNLQQSQLRHLQSKWLWSGHPFSSVFVECHKTHGQVAATSFLDLIIRNQASNIQNGEGLFGVLLGYEFLTQDSDLTKRRNGEKVSLENLRKHLDKTTTELIGEVEDFKNGFSDWDNNIKQGWEEWLNNSSKEHEDNQGCYQKEFIEYMDECKKQISDLENIYQEKLRLEKPATYWKKAASKYGIQGGLWSLALIATILLGFIYFTDFFTTWLKGQELGVKLNTIQGVIIYGTILTIFAFLVKTLSRLTFSSFHLMRDAEEREQLTYLYLSLNKDKEIDESSRDIVLQALFSRTETGLLATESGPTMPGIGEILKTASNIK